VFVVQSFEALEGCPAQLPGSLEFNRVRASNSMYSRDN
jgi:hypothetical protein